MMGKNYKDIKIEVIDSIKADTILPTVWEISRPGSKKMPLDKLAAIDTPLIEFPVVVMKISAPIFLREIFCTMRDHVIWAMTTRVDDIIENFNIDVNTVEFDADYDQILIDMQTKKDSGITQDQYRMELPMSFMTNWAQRASIREIGKIYKYLSSLLDDDLPDAQRNSIVAMCSELKEVIVGCGLDFESFITNIIPIDICPTKVVKKEEFIKVSDHSTEVNIHASLSLRAQLVRHRNLHVVDEYADYLFSSDLASTRIKEKVWMNIVAPNDFWDKIIEKRNCWLAQSDMWKPVVDLFSSFKELKLPCDSGDCKYAGDCQERIDGKDPGVQCPAYAAYSGLKVSDSVKGEMSNYVVESKRPKEYWDNIIAKIGE